MFDPTGPADAGELCPPWCQDCHRHSDIDPDIALHRQALGAVDLISPTGTRERATVWLEQLTGEHPTLRLQELLFDRAALAQLTATIRRAVPVIR